MATDWFFNLMNQHIFIAAFLGALIGLERELAGKDPSLRTFTMISMGSCIFSIISQLNVQTNPAADPSRIAAQIVSGIGFIGAGAIFRSTRGVSGLTTAALMWVTAGIGMAVGFDRIDLALSGTLIALFMNLVLQLVHRLIRALRSERPQPVE